MRFSNGNRYPQAVTDVEHLGGCVKISCGTQLRTLYFDSTEERVQFAADLLAQLTPEQLVLSEGFGKLRKIAKVTDIAEQG